MSSSASMPVELWLRVFLRALRIPDCICSGSEACQLRRCSSLRMFENERADLTSVCRLFEAVVGGCDLGNSHLFVNKMSSARLLISDAVTAKALRVVSLRIDLANMTIDDILGWILAIKRFSNLRRIEISGSLGQDDVAHAACVLLGAAVEDLMSRDASTLRSVFCDLPVDVVRGLRGRGWRSACSLSTAAPSAVMGVSKTWDGTTSLYVDMPFVEHGRSRGVHTLVEDEYPDLLKVELQIGMAGSAANPFLQKIAARVEDVTIKQAGLSRPPSVPIMRKMKTFRCFMGTAKTMLRFEQPSLAKIVLVGFAYAFFDDLRKRYRFAMDFDDELAAITERRLFRSLEVIQVDGLVKMDFKRRSWMQQELLVYRGWWNICMEEGLRLTGADGLELFDEELFNELQVMQMEPQAIYQIADGFVEYE